MTPSLRLIRLEDRVAPAVATWDGGGANDNWTTAANWVGDVAPQPRDDLVFPASVPRATNVNDFPAGTGFGSIRLGDPAYVIAGNDIALSGGIFVSFNTALTQTPQVGLGITLTAFQSFIATFGTGLTLTGSVDLNGQTLSASANTFRDRPRDPDLGNLTFAGPIRGAGDLVLGGIGVVVLKAANTYTGPTQIRGGCTLLASPAGLGAAGAGNETTVESGGGLCVDFPYSLDACPEAITFAAHEPGKASLDARGGTLSGPLALAGPNLFQGQGVTIDSVVGETGGPQHLTIFASTGFVGAEPFGDGRMVFGSESVLTYTGGTQIVHGEVRFDGTGNGPVVVPDGIVSGDGAIGAATLGRGAGVAPARTSADPLSTLTVNGDFSLDENSAFSLTIVHFLPDGRSDGVIVHGAVRLNGILRIPVSGYAAAIPAGTHYRIVDNDGADPVVGSFVGMPEGQIVASAGGRHLRITYDGGDGNDVDLVADGVDTPGRFAVGAGPGGLPIVNFYDGGGTLLRSFLAYDGSFRGGVRVATGDLNGDGYAEIVTAPGPGGGPHVKVFDGATGRLLTEFNAYDPTFTGGVFVATGRTNADFAPHIITGAGPGGGAARQGLRRWNVVVLPERAARRSAFIFRIRPGVHGRRHRGGRRHRRRQRRRGHYRGRPRRRAARPGVRHGARPGRSRILCLRPEVHGRRVRGGGRRRRRPQGGRYHRDRCRRSAGRGNVQRVDGGAPVGVLRLHAEFLRRGQRRRDRRRCRRDRDRPWPRRRPARPRVRSDRRRPRRVVGVRPGVPERCVRRLTAFER
ncbi:MAG TPA: hypothetical protein VL371_21295, partial [Gemmataceae bacterium]|nr:hypothetical protein [Gemmataceae bacterium]